VFAAYPPQTMATLKIGLSCDAHTTIYGGLLKRGGKVRRTTGRGGAVLAINTRRVTRTIRVTLPPPPGKPPKTSGSRPCSGAVGTDVERTFLPLPLRDTGIMRRPHIASAQADVAQSSFPIKGISLS